MAKGDVEATPIPGAPPAPILLATNITKRFGDLVANDGISLTLLRGEIHALLGENGAGKTTFCNIVYGLLRSDSGTLRLRDREVDFHSPRDAIAAGIAMVHQEFMLIPPMTVAENLAIMQEQNWRQPIVDLDRIAERVRAASREYGLAVDPHAEVRKLSAGERQRVEILKALFRGAEVLILDEPTSVLTRLETVELFDALRRMAASGKSIIFVSHKIDEVLALTDRVTVLRQGRVVAAAETRTATRADLARMIVGRDVLFRVERLEAAVGSPLLEVIGVSAKSDLGVLALDGVSLHVRAGELLGIAGVTGNGQRELVEVVTGLRKPVVGRVLVGGHDVTGWSPDSIRQLGVAHIPEEPRLGLVFDFPLTDNLLVEPHVSRMFQRGFFLDRERVLAKLRELTAEYDIRVPGPAAEAQTLSGGTKQKFLLARELFWEPRVVIANNPTKGLDVAATEYVRKVLMRMKASGKAVLLISGDLEEVLDLSDRVAVLSNGRFVGEFPIGQAKIEEIASLMTLSRAHS